jgi:hypothetical protein
LARARRKPRGAQLREPVHGGKPPADTLYRYGTAISGLIFYAITLAIVLWIANGIPHRALGLRRPESWPRALGLALAV